MTYKNSQMAHEARILKVVAVAVALFALALAALTITLAPSQARPEALLVATGTFGIALFMWTYASRPTLFSNDAAGVLGDELRSHYTVPVSRIEAPRTGAVSAHIYQWQSVRRVAPGERVWTREYVRLIALQTLGAIVGATLCAALIVGVTLGLSVSAGPIWFVAAGVILSVGFAMSHRSGLVEADGYAKETMAAMPDLTWQPTLLPAGPTAPVRSARAADQVAA